MARVCLTDLQRAEAKSRDLRNRILGEIRDKKIHQCSLAEEMGISKSLFTYRMNNLKFSVAEWLFLCKRLGVSIEEYEL